MNAAEVLAAIDWPSVPTARRIRHHVNRWSRWTGDPDLVKISTGTFDKFRQECVKSGLSPWTIESTIWEVCHLAHLAGYQVDPGRRLRRPAPHPRVPCLESIGLIYAAAGTATWPRRCWVSPEAWWRCLLVVDLWTGWRRSDLAGLIWWDVEADRLAITACKTGSRHEVPMTETVRRHLDRLGDQGHPERVFDLPRSSSYRACHDQLARLCRAADVRCVTFQEVRRLAVSNWTSVNAEAGRIIHGCGLGVMRHYLDPLAILRQVAPLVRLPAEFLTEV